MAAAILEAGLNDFVSESRSINEPMPPATGRTRVHPSFRSHSNLKPTSVPRLLKTAGFHDVYAENEKIGALALELAETKKAKDLLEEIMAETIARDMFDKLIKDAGLEDSPALEGWF